VDGPRPGEEHGDDGAHGALGALLRYACWRLSASHILTFSKTFHKPNQLAAPVGHPRIHDSALPEQGVKSKASGEP